MRAKLWWFLYENFQIFVTMADTNFTCTVKSADPENPLFGARILVISLIQAE